MGSGGLLRQVSVGGLVMPGQRANYAPDVWIAEAFDDWDDLADAKGGLADRALGHGSFAPASTNRSQLVATLRCWCKASSQAQLQQSRSRLKAVAATAGTVRVTVEREGELRWREGRVGGINLRDDRAEGYLTAEVDFVFPDPRLFGPAQPLASTGTYPRFRLDNQQGTAEGMYELTVTPQAAVNRIVLTVDGQQLAVETPITPGVPVEFFADSGVVLVGGLFAQRVRGVWPSVPAGQVRQLTVDGGGPTVSVAGNFYPAWW